MRAILIAVLLAAIQSGPDYPSTPKRPSPQTYGDTVFIDNYEWLESADDSAVKGWVAEENKLTRSILDAVPGRAAIAQRLTALFKAPRLGYFGVTERGGKLFAMKSAPPKEQPLFVVFDDPSDEKSERVLFDPTASDAKGGVSVDWYVPSLDA